MRALKLGDRSLARLEDRCVVERKAYPTLFTPSQLTRPVFVHRLRRMSQYPHPPLVITPALSQVKSPQPHVGGSPTRLWTTGALEAPIKGGVGGILFLLARNGVRCQRPLLKDPWRRNNTGVGLSGVEPRVLLRQAFLALLSYRRVISVQGLNCGDQGSPPCR